MAAVLKRPDPLPVEATVETPVVQQDRRVGRDVIPIFNLPLIDAVAVKDGG